MADDSSTRRPPPDQHDDFKLGQDIAHRLADFGAAVVQLSGRLPKDPTGRHIVIQMVRSATAAGANYEEAPAAESRADFIHKAGVALKELREARYWGRPRSEDGVDGKRPRSDHPRGKRSLQSSAHRSARRALVAQIELDRTTGPRATGQSSSVTTGSTGQPETGHKSAKEETRNRKRAPNMRVQVVRPYSLPAKLVRFTVRFCTAV